MRERERERERSSVHHSQRGGGGGGGRGGGKFRRHGLLKFYSQNLIHSYLYIDIVFTELDTFISIYRYFIHTTLFTELSYGDCSE